MSIAKLLIVDDDENLLELARTRLNAANYDVVAALDAEKRLRWQRVAPSTYRSWIFDLPTKTA